MAFSEGAVIVSRTAATTFSPSLRASPAPTTPVPTITSTVTQRPPHTGVSLNRSISSSKGTTVRSSRSFQNTSGPSTGDGLTRGEPRR